MKAGCFGSLYPSNEPPAPVPVTVNSWPSHGWPPHAVGWVLGSSALTVITAPGPGTSFGPAAAANAGGTSNSFFGSEKLPTVGKSAVGFFGPSVMVLPGA